MATDKNRQARSDSAAALIAAAKAAASPDLRPPAHVQLTADAEPYFADIVRARARDEWNPHQLTIAAQMAECMVEQEEVRGRIALDGWTVKNAKGTEVANPMVSIAEQLARRQMALGRSLQMIGRAIGDPRKPVNKRQSEKTARELQGEVAGEGVGAGGYDPNDDLLA